jgi:F0F1-type ATP synthase membrane subunit c/vacuolar-type H+-ATPase subunit K
VLLAPLVNASGFAFGAVLPVGSAAIASPWFDGSTTAPTVRAVVEHARLMLDADVSFR